MDSALVHKEFKRLVLKHQLRRISERSRKGGSVIELLVDNLKINCTWNYMDLTVAVTTAIDADDWTPGWAAVCFLFAFIEGKNDPLVVDGILNSSRQITWLVENFEEVQALMQNESAAARRHAFFEFQEKAFKERREKAVNASKRGPAS
jgi:hypothetical protein